ncbi:MAG: hypothetical protein IT226_16595 [Flavobacteriales bacterium]|nr:hypothetical protein [Flavobacteriales bacterium]
MHSYGPSGTANKAIAGVANVNFMTNGRQAGQQIQYFHSRVNTYLSVDGNEDLSMINEASITNVFRIDSGWHELSFSGTVICKFMPFKQFTTGVGIVQAGTSRYMELNMTSLKYRFHVEAHSQYVLHINVADNIDLSGKEGSVCIALYKPANRNGYIKKTDVALDKQCTLLPIKII